MYMYSKYFYSFISISGDIKLDKKVTCCPLCVSLLLYEFFNSIPFLNIVTAITTYSPGAVLEILNFAAPLLRHRFLGSFLLPRS